jgi:hypothetical protein
MEKREVLSGITPGALRGADRGAQIGLARQAGRARPAFRRVERNDVVALLDRRHARADVGDNARALVAEDRGKQTFRVSARQRELVGMADAARLDFNQNLTGARAVEFYVRYFQLFAGRERHGSAHFHGIPRVCDAFGCNGALRSACVCPKSKSAAEDLYDRSFGLD